MFRFGLGVIFGIFIATVGVSGIANMLDGGVAKVQEQARELAK